MNCFKIMSSLGLLFFALYNVELYAQESGASTSSEARSTETTAEVSFQSNPVVQELPDYSQSWLDGRVSLVGGEYTTSERQYLFAEANRIPVVYAGNFTALRNNGHLVRLEGPYIKFKSARVIPYVLPELRDVTVALSEAYHQAGCGSITINSALRLGNRRPLWNSSPVLGTPSWHGCRCSDQRRTDWTTMCRRHMGVC